MKVFLVLLFSSVILVQSPLFALDKNSNQSIRNKTKDLSKLKEELARKKNMAAEIEKQEIKLKGEMDLGRREITGIEKSVVMTEQKDREIYNDLAQTKNKYDVLAQDIERDRAQLSQSAGQYYAMVYLMGPEVPYIQLSKEALRMRGLGVQEKATGHKKVGEDLELLIDTQKIIQAELDRQKKYVSEIKTSLTKKEIQLEKKKTQKEILRSELRDLEKTAKELESLVEILRTKEKAEEEQQRKERLAKFQNKQFPISKASLSWPAQGKVTEKFGHQVHPQWGTLYNSNGIVVISGQMGSVSSVADGQVLFAGPFMSYGSMVLVEHPGDWYSVYGRLSKWNVEKGQQIEKGAIVGEMGLNDVGQAEVYFELRFYGKPTDPLPWLKK